MRRAISGLKKMATAMGLALLGGAGLLAFSAPVAAATPGWKPTDDDSLLLDLRSSGYRVGEALRGYQTPSGVCVDFADLVQALDLPVRMDKKSRRATGWFFAEDQQFTLDREAATVQNVNGVQPLSAEDIHDTAEGWCVETTALSRWMGVTLRPDLGNAALILESERKLPFLAAIERKSRAARLRPSAPFDISLLPQAPTPYRAFRAPSVDGLIKFGLRNEPRYGTLRETRFEFLAAGEIAGASVDARLASDTVGRPATLRLRAYRSDPQGRLLGPLHATQVAGGDVGTFAGNLTGQSAVGRGFFISNRRISRSNRFAVTEFRGTLPTGWDAELYRNGQLLAFEPGRLDGRYEFLDVDLLYGQNLFEVVLYGPQGQIRRETSEVPVGADNIPAGQTWYWAGIIDQGRDLIEFGNRSNPTHAGWRWGVGVERGLDARTGIGLAAQSLMLNGTRHTYLESTLTRALGPMLVELSGAQQFAVHGVSSGRALRAQALGAAYGVNFKAETLWVQGDYESELVTADQRREDLIQLEKSFHFGRLNVPVQIGLRRAEGRDGRKVTEALTRVSINTRPISLTAELSRVRTRVTYGPADPLGNETRLTLLANSAIGKVRLRGESRFGLGGGGFEAARVVGEVSLSERSDLRVTGDYTAENHRAGLGVALLRQFRQFSLRAEGDVATDGTVGAGLSFAFSFGQDPTDGRIRFSNEKLATNGQAAVEVFRDENADGRREAGEEAVKGAIVAAGLAGKSVPTDAAGRSRVTGLRPFQPVMLSVDTSDLEDALLQPATKGIVITPRPGIASKVSIALVPTGEVEGTLLDTNGDPREGVDLDLVDMRGAVTTTARSEYDGFFLFEKVPYGSYRVRLSAASASALGVTQAIIGTVTVNRAEPVARLGPTSLAPAPRIAQAAP